jgi:hypothetical protein
MLSGKQLINSNNEVVTGTIQTKTSNNLTASGATVTVPAGYYASQATKSVSTATQVTPSISVSSAGLITASATQTAGYVAAGTKSATKQLTVQAAQTITPGTSNKTIASGRYLTGTQTIKGDANLVAGNIKSGVNIFGVSGTYEGSGSSGGGSSGSESIETCTVELMASAPMGGGQLTFTNGNLEVENVSYTGMDMMMGITINPIKGSVLYWQGATGSSDYTGNVILSQTYVAAVQGDGSITYNA